MADPRRSRGDRLFIDDNTYSPEALSDMRRADVVFDPTQYRPEDSDPVSMTEFAKDRLIDMGQGFSDIPEYVANYLVRPDEAGQMSFIPPAEFASDAKNLATAMGQAAYEDPLAFATEMLPVASNVVSGIESNKLFKQADELDAQGRGEEASKLRSMASFASMDMLNPLPTAYLTGLVGDLLTPSVDAPVQAMVQKVKTALPFEKKYLKDYEDAFKKVSGATATAPFDIPVDIQNDVLKKIDKYFQTQQGTADDPIRAMILKGDLEPEAAGFNYESGYNSGTHRGVGTLPKSNPEAIRRQHDTTTAIADKENQFNALQKTRIEEGPMSVLNSGFRSPEDLQEARRLQNELRGLQDAETGRYSQTEERQFFDRAYDSATPFKGKVIDEDFELMPSDDRGRLQIDIKTKERSKIAEDLAERNAEYQQMLSKVNLRQPFKGFANQAELDRFDDLGLGARFPEEAAPFTGTLKSQLETVTPKKLIESQSSISEKENLKRRFEQDETLRQGIYDREVFYEPNADLTFSQPVVGFLMPEVFVDSLKYLDVNKLKNMSFPQMVKEGRKAKLKNTARVFETNDLVGIADVVRSKPRLAGLIKPELLLKNKDLETMSANSNGVMVRLNSPELTALEGVLMNNSVGGYYYNTGSNIYSPEQKAAFKSGATRIYSLRDPVSGRPRVTLDLRFDVNTGLPTKVAQIKGPSNKGGVDPTSADFNFIFEFLKDVGVTSKTEISEGNMMDPLAKAFNAEGGVASLANGGQAEYGITTL